MFLATTTFDAYYLHFTDSKPETQAVIKSGGNDENRIRSQVPSI